jgi:glutaredoxin
MYTMDDCPFCERASEIMREMGFPFEERNVAMLQYNRQLLEKAGAIKTPTIIIGHELLVKPGEEKLRATIKLAQTTATVTTSRTPPRN